MQNHPSDRHIWSRIDGRDPLTYALRIAFKTARARHFRRASLGLRSPAEAEFPGP